MKNKSLGVFLWLIGLVAAHLVLFLLSPEMTAARWITYGFTLFAFLSQLILWMAVWEKQPSNTEQFYSTPMLLYSTLYLLGQLIVCIVFSLTPVTVAKYVINKGTRKLHAVTCRTVKDSVGYSAGSDLNTLLEETDSKISYCKVCLKNDEKAQALVEAHNQKIKKS